MRKLVVENETWEYMIGKNNVVIKNPRDEKKMVLTLEKVTGRTSDTIRLGRKKGTSDGMVTPADIKAFILKEFPYVEDQAAE
jgi:hypothetical protein